MTKTNEIFIQLLDKQISYLQAAKKALVNANDTADDLVVELSKRVGSSVTKRKNAWLKRKKDGVV
jgi:hypothetical protein